MAVPGLKPTITVRAKVRIGEKRESKQGREYPSSLDYFVSDDPEFASSCPGEVRELRIVPAYDDPQEFFSTGLEWWIKDKNKKPLLACYTKDAGANPVALRMSGMLDPGQVPLSPELVGNQKLKIACPARECPHFKKKDCRPMARLTFYLEGGRTDSALELGTKSWNSIESLTGSLSGYTSVGSKVFVLSVAMRQEGDKKFPVLSIREETVQINTDADVSKADTLVALAKAVDNGEARIGLAVYLDATKGDAWRVNPALIARLREVGPEAAARTILERELKS